MTPKEVSNTIYSFDGNRNEWLELESDMMKATENFTGTEIEELMESESMEMLAMICEGIRFEASKKDNGTGKGSCDFRRY